MSSMKPTIIGIYGIPGCGKTTLKRQIQAQLGNDSIIYFDGSEVIDKLTQGGLQAFKLMLKPEKASAREAAIQNISTQCARAGTVGIVTGHLSFWSENSQEEAEWIYTPADLASYTHILYLDVPAEQVKQQRIGDQQRQRPDESLEHLRSHQRVEIDRLRSLCRNHRIEFTTLSSGPNADMTATSARLIKEFILPCSEDRNRQIAFAEVDRHLASLSNSKPLQSVLVIDGDKTLGPHDTGNMYFGDQTLRALFESKLGYSHTAFRQATLLYEEGQGIDGFAQRCDQVASQVSLYPEVRDLISELQENDQVGIIVVTCGIGAIWRKVLDAAGISTAVKVIGEGSTRNAYVVTPEVKAAIVERLQDVHHVHVCAVGDSPLDMPMLKAADQAVVVVGDESIRSKSMDQELRYAMPTATSISTGTLGAKQVLLPETVSPRNIPHLDKMRLSDLSLRAPQAWQIDFQHATAKGVAKVLMTQMRDASMTGRSLQEAHRQVGWYLAQEYLTETLGLETYSIHHVQGSITAGFRLNREDKTLVIAMMRGGEPMAFGVHDAFPRASFLHASEPQDIKMEHLQGTENIILVDSVINSGRTIADHVNHIRKFGLPGRIAVVAGVVQSEAVSEDGLLARGLAGYGRLSVVALRKSENKYTGKGGTDTGNRLFNTTHLD